jgi:hypothetical protein
VSAPPLDDPGGYRVHVTGARVVSGSSASTLVLAQRAGVSSVTLRVTPR